MTLAIALFAPTAQATLVDYHTATVKGADRLLEIQFEDGAFPWIVGDPGKYQNVQGVTAIGLLDAYEVTLDERYLAGAKGTRDWLAAYMNATEGYISASNVYFLAEYALLTGNAADLDLAREALQRAIDDDRWDDTPTALAENILTVRARNYGALGLWDVSLFVRAAQDVGDVDAADELAAVLAAQMDASNADRIVDPMDPDLGSYALGLAGLVLGLTEADLVGYQSQVDAATAALRATQNADGSFGEDDLGEGDAQVTAYAVMAFVAVGDVASAHTGADYLVQAQNPNGGWTNADFGTIHEFGESNAEAVSALAAATAPVPTGVTAYADALVAVL